MYSNFDIAETARELQKKKSEAKGFRKGLITGAAICGIGAALTFGVAQCDGNQQEQTQTTAETPSKKIDKECSTWNN